MVGTKLIRDCCTVGSATTRGLSCVFSAMIIIGCTVSEGGGGKLEARVGSVCSAEDTIKRREVHQRILRERIFETCSVAENSCLNCVLACRKGRKGDQRNKLSLISDYTRQKPKTHYSLIGSAVSSINNALGGFNLVITIWRAAGS